MEQIKCPCDTVIRHEQELREGAVTMAEIKKDLESIKSDMAELKADVKELKEKPARRYDQIINYILNAILAGVIGYIMYKLRLI